jgi:Ca2+-binding EF-hand superfamily protein
MNRKIRYASLLSLLGALALSPAAFAQHADMFATMDGNGDGKISAEEHAAGASAMFAKVDANHDGSVTAEEMKAGHAAMGEGSKKGCDMPCCDKMKEHAGHDMGAMASPAAG